MPRTEPHRRVRIDEGLCLRLEKRMQEAGRRGDLSPFVEEICHNVLNGRAVVLSEEMVARLQKFKQEMRRKEEISPFVEWICELFLEDKEKVRPGEIVVDGRADKLRDTRGIQNEERQA